MSRCSHATLELLPSRKKTLRCRHCYLTIDGDELGDSCCPECLERSGTRRYEFEEVQTGNGGIVRYRCEDCGAIIEST
jgi:hypothetical protein